MKPHLKNSLERVWLEPLSVGQAQDLAVLETNLRDMDAALRLAKEALESSCGLVSGCNSFRIQKSHKLAKEAIEELL